MITLWLCELNGLTDDIYESLYHVLPEREKSHLKDISNHQSKAEKVVSRCLVYVALEESLGTSIDYGDIEFPSDAPPLYHTHPVSLSLSHSKGGVVVALSHDGRVGVDILDQGRPKNWQAIAEAYFPQIEITYLNSLPDGAAAFRQLWCWKEALVKASGLSLAEALRTPVWGRDVWLDGKGRFHFSAFDHGSYTLGLAAENSANHDRISITPQKILASLRQTGQN